ncbi:MAG: TlpA family protein disulfide reductase [Bryobacterales bacterium]|nr:TlpA family protein disulfide reductase [Bryobacterales bacterium]
MSQTQTAAPVPAKPGSNTVDRTLVLMIGAALLGVCLLMWDAVRDRVIKPGDPAPDFQVTTLDGRTLTRSNFGGKVLILNFWASWCPPCAEETPSMELFHKRLKDKGVVLLAVSVDKKEDKYKNFLKRFGVTFPTAFDPEAKVSDSYGTYRYPETYIVNKDGRVVEKIIGRKNWIDENFIKSIEGML